MESPPVPPAGISHTSRGLFCNRTLNMRSLKAIGYDMDYTLIHYHVAEWESCAFSYLKERLLDGNWPVRDLTFDPEMAIQGLIIDLERGNIVKANRFGYIKRAYHGTRPIGYDTLRRIYTQTLVDLSEPRWVFLNTLFAISEASFYMQLVDLLDQGVLSRAMGYADLYQSVRHALNQTHIEGRLKAEIIADPERFVDLDPDTPLALLDQKRAGKKVILVTNSEWEYAAPMLNFAFNRFLPEGMTWRELFDLSIVGARKPDFFMVQSPAYEVVNNDGLLRESRGLLEQDKVYVGGHAGLVEESLGLNGEQILYVGDHMFSDVRISKKIVRWRAALILRELEEEIQALQGFEPKQRQLSDLMTRKVQLEGELSQIRLETQRNRHGYGPQTGRSPEVLETAIQALRTRLIELDTQIAPLAKAAGQLRNPNWGLLLRAGNDKSHLASQLERYADIYTSRVSNFLSSTPYVYLRSQRGSLPHEF